MHRLFATRPIPQWLKMRRAVAWMCAFLLLLIVATLIAGSLLDAYAEKREREAARLSALLLPTT